MLTSRSKEKGWKICRVFNRNEVDYNLSRTLADGTTWKGEKARARTFHS
jgi:hypothetical protein